MDKQEKHLDFIYMITFIQIATILIYLFGPISYNNQNKSIEVAIFIAIYLLSLNIGYRLSANIFIRNRIPTNGCNAFIKRSIIITIIISIPTFLSRTGDIGSSGNIGELYNQSQEIREASGSTIEYIRILFGLHLFGLLPVLLCTWNNVPKNIKLIAVASTLATPLISALSGINKNIFDYLILLTSFYIIGIWRPYQKTNNFASGKKLILLTLAGGIFSLSGLFFVEGQLTRYGSPAISGVNPRTGMTSEYNINDGKILVLYSAMASYLTQGYQAFELALDQEISFNWGVSNSTFLSRQVDRIFGTDTNNKSLPAAIEKYGWDRYIDWSSFYVWMASDFSFYGLIPIMIAIGWIFRIIVNSVQHSQDVYSQILLGYSIIGLYYLSANNQLLQSGETCVPFLVILATWLVSGKIHRIKRQS